MFKKGILAALILISAAGASAQRRQVMLDKVVAVVGGSSILYSEVDEYARQLVEQRRQEGYTCLLYTSPSPRDSTSSRMPSSA